MPLELDDYDVSILKSLLKDGRKSFRKISRETGITTPTVKARFSRLVNIGFIKFEFLLTFRYSSEFDAVKVDCPSTLSSITILQKWIT